MATPDSEVLDFGELTIPRPGVTVTGTSLYETTFVRTWIRKHRYGEADKPTGYRVEVTRLSGVVEEWTFDSSISWPLVDGAVYDWDAEWLEVT